MDASETGQLSAATSGFALAAAITVLINTAISCAKDAYAPLKAAMKSVAGHGWTTQGLFDLALFVALGLIFMKTGAAQRITPGRLTAGLVGCVIIAGLGLALWFAFV
jgi:hypothetical protein